jgi:transcriptional regulator with XRE-family HTH domain
MVIRLKERGEVIVNKLKALRIAKGFTQAQIAEKVGITPRCYQRYEANDQRVPSVTTALGIADVLKVDNLREIWGGNPLSQV